METEAPATTRADRSLYLIHELSRTARTGFRTAGGVAVVYFAFRALEALAGHDTSLSVTMSLVLKAFFELKFALAVALAGSFAIWARVERSLRHRKVDQMQKRIRDLETTIDPERSSSGLTTKGTTNPQDRAP